MCMLFCWRRWNPDREVIIQFRFNIHSYFTRRRGQGSTAEERRAFKHNRSDPLPEQNGQAQVRAQSMAGEEEPVASEQAHGKNPGEEGPRAAGEGSGVDEVRIGGNVPPDVCRHLLRSIGDKDEPDGS